MSNSVGCQSSSPDRDPSSHRQPRQTGGAQIKHLAIELNGAASRLGRLPLHEEASVNGVIQFNTPTLYSGTKFENVRLVLKDGKIIEATANHTKRLNAILDTDAGGRYIGEFSLGFNPHILSPMCDIL